MIELSGLLQVARHRSFVGVQYIVNRLRTSDCADLIVLKELILQMSGMDGNGICPLSLLLSMNWMLNRIEQTDDQSGGEVLRNESSVILVSATRGSDIAVQERQGSQEIYDPTA